MIFQMPFNNLGDPGSGFTGAPVPKQYGQVEIIDNFCRVTIYLDLHGMTCGGTAGDIIGGAGGAANAWFAKYDQKLFGSRFWDATFECPEAPVGGDTDIDIYTADEDTGAQDAQITSLTNSKQIFNVGTWSAHMTPVKYYYTPVAGQAFYLVGNNGSGAALTAGRCKMTWEGEL